MLETLTLLLVLQLIGEVLVRLLALPIPGPVLGMLLLFVGLMLRAKDVPDAMGTTVDGLLRHLSMLFVPAGVGVVMYMGVVADAWLAIGASLFVSTLLTIAVTGWLMKKLSGEDQEAHRDREQIRE